MRHEKVIKREDGTRVKITVELISYRFVDKALTYDVNVTYCEKGKKTWQPVYDTDSFNYRKLSIEERREFIDAQKLLAATPAEILSAKLELWEKIKPC